MSSPPPIGALILHEGNGYRVQSYLKRYEPTPVDCYDPMRSIILELRRKFPPEGHGPDGCPLVWCPADEAEYVSASGVCGVIVRVSEVKVTGMVDWPDEMIAAERAMADRMIGQRVF